MVLGFLRLGSLRCETRRIFYGQKVKRSKAGRFTAVLPPKNSNMVFQYQSSPFVSNAPMSIARMPMLTNKLMSTAPAKLMPMALITKMLNEDWYYFNASPQ